MLAEWKSSTVLKRWLMAEGFFSTTEGSILLGKVGATSKCSELLRKVGSTNKDSELERRW